MQAMILAAGLGSRLKPFTDKHPKALAPVNGKSLLQRNVEYLLSYGINDIVVNVHHFAGQIIEAVEAAEGWGANIIISDESTEVLETGGGLKKAGDILSALQQPFVLMNADILTNMNLDNMLEKHFKESPLATLAVTSRHSSRYLLFDGDRLCGWKNDATGELKGRPGAPFAFSGIHIISPAIFPLITESGKFSMIDVYLRLAPDHHIIGYDHSDSLLLDVGKPESLAIAQEMFE